MSPRALPASSATQPLQPFPQPCQHPVVQYVCHGKDAEFVECMDCREVFDPAEFKAMEIEKRLAAESEA